MGADPSQSPKTLQHNVGDFLLVFNQQAIHMPKTAYVDPVIYHPPLWFLAQANALPGS